jgi:hypothetical protein
LFIVGGAFFALPLLAMRSEKAEAAFWVFALAGLFVLLGCCMLFVSVLGSRRLVEKWSEASGNHEVSIVIFLVALPIAWIIRRVIRGDAA